MEAFEPVLLADRPSWVVVLGDVNFTLACSLVATLHAVAASRPLVWPLHPRVRPALVLTETGEIVGRRPELWDGATAGRVCDALGVPGR